MDDLEPRKYQWKVIWFEETKGLLLLLHIRYTHLKVIFIKKRILYVLGR